MANDKQRIRQSIDADARRIAQVLEPRQLGDMRIGIFMDRTAGSTFAIILNPANHRYAALTTGEHDFKSDDYDSMLEAVNEVCADIMRWSAATADEIH